MDSYWPYFICWWDSSFGVGENVGGKRENVVWKASVKMWMVTRGNYYLFVLLFPARPHLSKWNPSIFEGFIWKKVEKVKLFRNPSILSKKNPHCYLVLERGHLQHLRVLLSEILLLLFFFFKHPSKKNFQHERKERQPEQVWLSSDNFSGIKRVKWIEIWKERGVERLPLEQRADFEFHKLVYYTEHMTALLVHRRALAPSPQHPHALSTL